MSKHLRWLRPEIERWVGENIISAEQAARIRALYPAAAAPAAWGLIVFFGIGSVVIGLGVILLLAYNWAEIPKAAKLALVFGSVAGVHGVGLTLHTRPDWRSGLGEGLALLGTMLFGAGIWLVAQVYHINEHFPNGFLVWGLGALAMAWALPSISQAILAAVTLTIWSCAEVVEFGTTTDVASIILAVGLGALVWRLRSAVLAAVVLAGLYFTLLFNAGEWGGGSAVFLTALSLSTLLIAGDRLLTGAAPWRNVGAVLRFFGLLGTLFCAYLGSFHDVADDLLRSSVRDDVSGVGLALYRWGVTGLALAAWGWVVVRVRRGERELVALEDWLFPASLLCVQAFALMGDGTADGLLVVVFNLVILFVGAMWAVRGCREGRMRPIVLGSLLIALLVFARYFDLFDSLAVRGLVFLALGAALFGEGFYYRHLRQAETARKPPQ